MKASYATICHIVALSLTVTALISVMGGHGTGATTLQREEPPKPAPPKGLLVPLRVAYSAVTVNQAVPWISYEAGLFKKHGLDVELIHASSITALQALLASEVSIAQSVTDACVS